MGLPNGNEPPEGPPARTIAARIVGKLSTLAGVSLTTRAQVSAIDVIANEVRPLTDGITERDAELVRAGLWRHEQRRREDVAEIQRLHNRITELQEELARLDDTDVLPTTAACGTCADTREAMLDGKYVDCPKCGPAPSTCERCQGDGKQHEHHMRGHYPETLISTCDLCGGTGNEPPEPGNASLVIDDGLLDIATRCGGPG